MNALTIANQTTISLALIAADQHPATVYLASLSSETSRRTMQSALNEIARIMGFQTVQVAQPGKRAKLDVTYTGVNWATLRYQHTAAIRAKLQAVRADGTTYAPSTVNKMLSALRGVLSEARKLGLMSADECAAAIDIPIVKGETLPAGRDLSIGELVSLVNVCKADKTPAGSRDAALIGVLYTCGLRRAELAALKVADFDAESGKLVIHSGKGRKDRTVYVTNGAATALVNWLVLRGTEAGALFTSVRRGGHVSAQGMTPQAVYGILKTRATEAGVKDFSPHDLRRTFVSDLLDRGNDIVTVQKLAGHSDPKTTSRYDRRGEETKKRAANSLHFPY